MKKCILFLFILVFAIGCSEDKTSSKKEEQKKTDPEPSITLQNDIQLAYKFELGDKFSYKFTNITNSTQIIQADSSLESGMSQTINYLVDFEVTGIDENKNIDLNISIKSVDMTGQMNGTPISYKTGDKLSDEDRNQFIEFESMANTTYSAQITPTGEALKVGGVEQIVNNMLEIKGIEKTISIRERLSYIGQVKNAIMKPLTQQLFRILPDHNVNTGSQWHQDYSIPLAVYKINNRALFKIASFVVNDADTLVKIDASLQMTYSGENITTQEGVEYIFGEPKVTGQGFINFNITRGCLQNSETTTSMELGVVMNSKDSAGKPISGASKDITTTSNIINLLSYSKNQLAVK